MNQFPTLVVEIFLQNIVFLNYLDLRNFMKCRYLKYWNAKWPKSPGEMITNILFLLLLPKKCLNIFVLPTNGLKCSHIYNFRFCQMTQHWTQVQLYQKETQEMKWLCGLVEWVQWECSGDLLFTGGAWSLYSKWAACAKKRLLGTFSMLLNVLWFLWWQNMCSNERSLAAAFVTNTQTLV